MVTWATREGSNLKQGGVMVDVGGVIGKVMIPVSMQVDGNGVALGQTYQLATALASLAASANTGTTAGIAGGSYIWDYVLGGTTPSLVLEALSSDGTNYVTIATVTASGRQGVVIGNNATVRLRNAGANAITGLSSSIS